MTNNKKGNFLLELKELLSKYDATIGFTVSSDSDTYGLYEEAMIIKSGGANVLRVEGWAFDANDINN